MIYSANGIVSLRLFKYFLCYLLMQSLVQVSTAAFSARGDDLVRLQDERITESSGLVASQRKPAIFWTHNDSGSQPELYAFDRAGHLTGQAILSSVPAVDWEDVAPFSVNGTPWLVVADTGNNALRRKSLALHFFPEPDPTEKQTMVKPITLICHCPDGPMDCEAIAVDMKLNRLWFVAKAMLPHAGIYTLPLPDLAELPKVDGQVFTLNRAGMIAVPMITGMAIDSEKEEVVLINYFCALRYPMNGSQAWWQSEPTLFELPKLKQIEAIAIDSEHQWWITSEGSPCVLTKVDQSSLQHGRKP